MADGQERSEPATPKRRERARQEGEHPRSAFAICAASWWLAAIVIALAHEFASQWIESFLRTTHGIGGAPASDQWSSTERTSILHWSAAPIWAPAVGAGIAALLSAAASAIACGAVGWAMGALRWRLNRL